MNNINYCGGVFMKHILGKLRRAVQDFNMIQDGDKIAVGLSGGKDSTLLLYALSLYSKFSPQKFEVCAITINLGFKEVDYTPLKEFCSKLNVEYNIIDTNISEIVFNIRKEKNPCSLCANLRRGALNNNAKALGCNKVALGHHSNDAEETLLMSLLYEGRISTFSPVTYLARKDIYIIRPFVYIREKDIIGACRKNNIPIVENPCPANGYTSRQYIKELIKKIKKDVPEAESNIFGAIMNIDELNIWDKEQISKICKK